MELKQTDQEQYIENNIYNIKYLIRDVLTYKQLLIIREFLTEIIEKLDLNISMKYNVNSINENIFLNGINNELDKLGSEISDIENYFNKIQNT